MAVRREIATDCSRAFVRRFASIGIWRFGANGKLCVHARVCYIESKNALSVQIAQIGVENGALLETKIFTAKVRRNRRMKALPFMRSNNDVPSCRTMIVSSSVELSLVFFASEMD